MTFLYRDETVHETRMIHLWAMRKGYGEDQTKRVLGEYKKYCAGKRAIELCKISFALLMLWITAFVGMPFAEISLPMNVCIVGGILFSGFAALMLVVGVARCSNAPEGGRVFKDLQTLQDIFKVDVRTMSSEAIHRAVKDELVRLFNKSLDQTLLADYGAHVLAHRDFSASRSFATLFFEPETLSSQELRITV